MLKAGITGGIGSGKTTVCKLLELLDVPVFYADDEAKKLYADNKIKAKVVSIFGKKILNRKSEVDKKKLARFVFADRLLLHKLNAVIHPAVRKKFAQWLRKHKEKKYALKEAAILIESGAYNELDFIILVKSTKELIFKRLKYKDNIKPYEIKRRMKEQISDVAREQSADAIILNDGKHSLIEQTLKIHNRLIKK